MEVIAHIRSAFKTKFGVPRQSGLVEAGKAEIVFTPPYRDAQALRGLDGYSHIWLLWDFSEAHRPAGEWSPTVRPPRLGGNQRMGVWATRSPFRPNSIGLSSVLVRDIRLSTPEGPIIVVEGADLMDGTPIFDIKPYLPFTDCHPDARGGFAQEQREQERPLTVRLPASLPEGMTHEELRSIRNVLAADPRPGYHAHPDRTYGMTYGRWEVRFRIKDDLCEVVEIVVL